MGPTWKNSLPGCCHGLPALLIRGLSKVEAVPEFVIFTWFPNLLILPFVTLAQEDDYFNTAQMVFGPRPYELLSWCCIPLMISYPMLGWTYRRTEWEGSCCGCVCWAIMWAIILACRIILVVMLVIIFLLAWLVLSVDWTLALGFDFTLLANFSFRFGLTSWCSLVRAGVFVGTSIELLLTGRTLYLQALLEKSTGDRKEPMHDEV